MVKKLEFRGAIHFASPEMVFKLLFEDDAFSRLYHKEVSKDENATVTSWTDVDGRKQRTITFKPQLSDLPVFLRYLLGGDLPPVREIQEYEMVDTTYIIRSEVSLDVSRYLKVQTKGETILSSMETGCAIVFRLTLEFRTRYGQEWLESYAESESGDVFEQWLDLARRFCEKKIGTVQPTSCKAGEHSAASTANGNDLPHDVKALGRDGLSTSQNVVEVRPTRSSAIYRRLWFLRALWRSLSETVKSIFINSETDRQDLCRHSNFFLKAGISFGLGILSGLTSGLLSSKHLKSKKIAIRGA